MLLNMCTHIDLVNHLIQIILMANLLKHNLKTRNRKKEKREIIQINYLKECKQE